MGTQLVASLLGLALLVGILQADTKPESGTLTIQATLARGNRAFALDLYSRLSSQKGNLFFSPNSISTALAMTYAGARGQTAEQMASVLHFGLDRQLISQGLAAINKDLVGKGPEPGYRLNVANSLWAQQGYPFKQEFLHTLETDYRAALHQVDFQAETEAARRAINAWVEKETQDKIRDLIKPGMLNAASRLVLANAIYFKGDWVSAFSRKLTSDAPFHMSALDEVSVPMMHQKRDFRYLEAPAFQILELPYRGDKLSMLLFLPRRIDGLAQLERELTGKNLSAWLPKLHEQEVAVTMPRFKMTSEFDLGKVLGQMGMPLAFEPGQADFSGMDGERNLYISAVVHKAFVDVNEEGTEAAAATGVAVRALAARRPAVFQADHPFLFLIRDRTYDNILFLGRITDPRSNQ
jgi:serpin B